MDRGLLIVIAIGAVIVYFATSFSGDGAMDSDDTSWSVSKKNKLDAYYEKDVLGNKVLNFSSVALAQAKTIWPSTPTAHKIASSIPDFDLARLQAENSIVKGAFRQYVLHYLDKLEGKFLVGEIRSDQAQKALVNFR